jgi:hypothetical protein
VVAVCALAGVGGAWLATREGDRVPEPIRQPPGAEGPAAVAAPAPEPSVPPIDGVPEPELEGYRETIAFRDELASSQQAPPPSR